MTKKQKVTSVTKEELEDVLDVIEGCHTSSYIHIRKRTLQVWGVRLLVLFVFWSASTLIYRAYENAFALVIATIMFLVGLFVAAFVIGED